jgi:hypothetical protein
VFLTRQVVGDRGRMNGFSADAANDVWAVEIPSAGTAAILHFNGTSWSIIATRAPAGGQLDGVTALGDGTVVAVAVSTNSSGMTSGLIVDN